MSSISHALATADSIRHHLTCESKKKKHHATNPKEISEGEAAKRSAVNALKSSVSLVENTLAALKKAAPTKIEVKEALKPVTRAPVRFSKAVKNHIDFVPTDPMASVGEPVLKGMASDETPVKNVQEAMSADGLKPTVKSLQQMAEAIEPIIKNFDSVLTKPYLKNYNATINTVPVVGLKNNQIMYIETQQDLNPLGSGVKDVWSNFGALPADATIEEGDKVFMFPYKGDFCLAIGQAVWKRAHLAPGDPALSSAVDNWPNMYVKDWVKLGDEVLPSADILDIVPFAQLSADRNQIAFQLVVLTADHTILYLTSDILGPESEYEELRYVQRSPAPNVAPEFTNIAYWDNHIIGYDNDNNTWNLTPNFQDGTYIAADQVQVEPITEMTATDVGLVGVRADGYLYKRVVDAPPPDTNADATLKWTRWIQQDGVTNLGVASPGVMLDLNILTRTLRSRYIDVQTSVYPVVDTIRAWGITHSFYLRNVQIACDEYRSSGSEEKAILAIQQGKAFATHAKTWALIVNKSVFGAKESVNIMTKQLHDVRTQLETQLQMLKDKLVGLQSILEQEKKALSTLTAAFWGMVGAMFLGLALAIVGTVTMNPYVLAGAGVLFVGGIVAMVALATQMSELAKAVADTEAQIRDINIAIKELSDIVKNFQDLDDLYGTLNQFWGRMANDASAIKTMDDVTALQIGAGILDDPSSVDASAEMTQLMTDACQTYLDVLNRQGIQIPDQLSLTGFSAPSMMTLVSPELHAKKQRVPAKRQLRSLTFALQKHTLNDQFHEIVEAAQKRLAQRDIDGYEHFISHAAMVNEAAQSEKSDADLATGMWFDVASLRSTGSVWGDSFSSSVDIMQRTAGLTSAIAQDLSTKGSQIGGALDSVRPYVISMLERIVHLGETAQCWAEKYPRIPNQYQAGKVEALQQKAIEACEEAQHYAALANNSFAEFNHQATQFQQDLDGRINGTLDDMEKEKRAANEEAGRLSPPWYIYLEGPAGVLIWIENEKNNIQKKLNAALGDLDRSVKNLRDLQQSGLSFNGNSETWIQMCQQVSGDLGKVYNILSGIWGQLLEDPVLYASFIKIEWAQLVDSANEVLSIIGGHAPFMLATVTKPKTRQTRFKSPAALASKDDKAQLITAVSPSKGLGPRLDGQAKHAQEVFTNLDLLLQQPYGKDIIGFWEDGESERRTLFDVATSLRTEYVQMAAMEYDTVQSLYSLSILQEARANNVVNGKLPLDVFVNVTLQSIGAALQTAKNTSAQFGEASKEFDFVLSVIEANINEIETKIKSLDDSIETADKKLRDQIIWLVADIIALSFATAALLIAFGILGPVGAALTLGAQLGATAAVTATSVKLVMDSMSLADIAKTISSLKAMRSTLSDSLVNLKAVQPLFKIVVTGVNELTDTLTDMKSTLEQTMDKLSIIDQLSLSKEDARQIGAAWTAVKEDAQVWMDVMNAQGISPITYSVRN